MKKEMKYVILSTLVLISCSTKKLDNNLENKPEEPFNGIEKLITIDASKTYQTIEGFGASDCWTPNYVGQWWTSSKDKIAELLFSNEIVNGQPLGIGLSMWRVIMGGGSSQQGEQSGIKEPSRRSESYLEDDMTYNWNRCKGQRFFMDKATEMGCEKIILFANSPNYHWTKNGKATSQSGKESNLKDEYYNQFAKYMADVAKHYIMDCGYPISHISPVNEPQYNWNSDGQEGSGWQNHQVAKLARELDKELTKYNLPVDILIGEAGDWTALYKYGKDAGRTNVMEAFFDQKSENYIGNLDHIKDNLICGHSYWTDGSWNYMRKIRKELKNRADQFNVKLWQSEWSMLGDGYSPEEFIGFNNATETDIALYMAKVIHNDLTQAQVSSWSFWTAMDEPRWGHKNRFHLISLYPQNHDFEKEGSFIDNPNLWVLGNYSRFIKPGYKRIELSLNETKFFFGSAWISPNKDTIVSVFGNLSERNIKLNENHINWNNKISSIKTYTTSSNKKLKEKILTEGEKPIIESHSVTTIVYKLK